MTSGTMIKNKYPNKRMSSYKNSINRKIRNNSMIGECKTVSKIFDTQRVLSLWLTEIL